MIKIAILLVVVHLVYYIVFQAYSDIKRVKSRLNMNHKMILWLQEKYKVNIRLFHTNSKNHHGFAMHRSIYLAYHLLESKSKKYKALVWTFHHEHYHLLNKHKAKTLIARFVFAFTPMLIPINLILFVTVYLLGAYFMYWMNEKFEINADQYANEKYDEYQKNNYSKE